MSEDNDYQNGTFPNRPLDHETNSSPQQFKLPKLAPPSSRGRLPSRKQNKLPFHLPSINDDISQDQQFRNTQMIDGTKSENDMFRTSNQFSKDQFALEIEDKFRLMMPLQQKRVSQTLQEEQNYKSQNLSDDLDFEQKILQNKEIIKMHRIKNQPKPQKKKPHEALQKIMENHRPKLTKHQSNYERRMKDYNFSLQNKYLQRKKQSLGIIPEKPQKNQIQMQMQRARSKKNITSLPDASINNDPKPSFGYKQFKNSAISKSQAKQSSRPLASLNINKSIKEQLNNLQKQQKQSARQIRKTEEPLSPLKKINRTSALFDNIQTFLENPTAAQKHEKFYKQLFRKLKAKSIPKLQEQLKEMNEKLGTNQNFGVGLNKRVGSDTPFLLFQNPFERTVRDWKRIDLKEKNRLKCKESDFEKELEYISYLQQKSSVSLSKFIDQQKMMIELQMNRKLSKSINKQVPIETKESNASEHSLEERG